MLPHIHYRPELKKKKAVVYTNIFFFNFQFPVGSHTDLWVSFLDVTDGTCLFDRIDIFEGITSRTFTTCICMNIGIFNTLI